ncbi:PucR family transcriptional regulator [Virgibacillus oceani]|uniref:Transcriptional activator AdeR n=1 Tax=Virgibacillus oceani TaxID=1479511 RepID=A0A917HLK6_9BACI|nr:helix-turn-helix domain-containing protein [Virgibacillus oceani]GGG83276.1 transcriptional activator AdeR [Virgibacillus oceani]
MSHSSDYNELFKDDFDSLEGLADRIGEILDCPITIEDSNHRILSYSMHEKNIDDARIATIIRRKVPEKVINSLWKHGVMGKLFESDDPVIIPAIEKVGLGNRIAVSVRKNNEVLGFIWAQTDNKTLSDEKINLLKEAANLVTKQLLKLQIKKKKAEESYQEFFWKLLTGHVQQKSVIERQAKQFGLRLDGRLAIAMIEYDCEITQTIEKHSYYLTETLQLVHVVCRVFDQNQLILLIRVGENGKAINALNEFIQNFIHKISERLQINDVKGSFGIIYDSPQFIKNSYSQASKVLEVKEQFSQELKNIYSYQELGIYQFLDELYKIRSKEQYRNYAIDRLKEYDRKHHSELLATLKVYLECDSNVHRAANLIHVHTNTLNYRLKRIVEIAEIDLKDPNQKTTIYLDLKLESIRGDNM